MEFQRGEASRYKKLSKRWRKPRGIHSKMRKHKKGKRVSPCIGFRTKGALRGLHPSGYKEILTYNSKSLETIDKDVYAIRIAAVVGKRKREEILKKSKKLQLKVLNHEL
jgi:large subunit ribosomal protein L32e|tara:strand:- start:5424 stop:5750 length:327 start_codon:yes stop_codon:yes gene_type:complete